MIRGTCVLVAVLVAGCASPQLPTARPSPPTETATDPFERLAARPIAIPDLPVAPCPVSSASEIDERVAEALGDGPVFAVIAPPRWPLAGQARSAFQRYSVKTLWISTDPLDERILVRVARIDAHSSDEPVPGFSQGAANLPGDVYTQLRLGPAGSVRFNPGPMPEGWRAWSSSTLVDGPGCYAFQVDTPRTTVHVVFEVVP